MGVPVTTTDGRSQLRRSGREMVIPTQALILRFRIELQESDPLIWREIEVPGDSTFWDLHVAIQDAMGWLDYHLHRFTMPHPRTKQERVFGIHNLSQDCDGDKALGASMGLQASIGIAIRAERIDKDGARNLREEGIEHAGLFFELTYAWVNHFGSSHRLNVGDLTWFAGFNFEF